MNKYHTPNESQMRTAVKGADRYDYYKRRRVPWLKILLTIVFFGLITFVFLFGLMRWRLK